MEWPQLVLSTLNETNEELVAKLNLKEPKFGNGFSSTLNVMVLSPWLSRQSLVYEKLDAAPAGDECYPPQFWTFSTNTNVFQCELSRLFIPFSCYIALLTIFLSWLCTYSCKARSSL
jgi:hypothetical protein